jgi:hypothetical protein
MGRKEFDRMVHGDQRNRDETQDEITDLGRTAIKGMTTVATVSVAGSVLGGVLGSMK